MENEDEKFLKSSESDLDIEKERAHNLKVLDLMKLSVRAFWVRPARTLLTVLGMSIGIGAVFFLISLGYGLQYILLGKLAPTEDSLISLQASYPEEGNLMISHTLLSEILNMPGAFEVSPISQTSGQVESNGYTGDLMVKIIDDKYIRLSGFLSDYSSEDKKFEEGVIISNTALRLLGMPEDAGSLGKMVSVSVVYQILDKDQKPVEKTVFTKGQVPITSIVKDDSQAPYIFVPENLMQEKPSFFALFYVKAKDDDSLEPLRSMLVSKGFIISAKVDTVRQARGITNIITIVLGVFGVVALFVSSIGMFNTMLISFMERIFEVGIMKSIGATKRDILSLFLAESFIMGILGGVGGLVLGFGLGTAVNFGMNVLARYLGGKPVNLFIYPGSFVIFILILSGIVGLLSGYWPARRASKLSAREAFLRK
jgi:putative ABC transport system permease protein